MAVRKTTTTKRKGTPRKTAPVRRSHPSRKSTSLLDYFRFGESYTSLILGVVVVIVAAILLVSLFKTRNNSSHLDDSQKGTTSISTIAQELNKVTPTQSTSATPTSVSITNPRPTVAVAKTPTPSPTVVSNKAGQKTYTVKSGDDLWKIAETVYHDGYQWVAIAKANNLTNPSIINVGNHFVLPSITPTPTQIVQSNNPTQLTPVASSQAQKISGSTYVIMHGDNLWDISIRAYGDGYRWTDIAKANNLTNPNLIHSGNSLKIPR